MNKQNQATIVFAVLSITFVSKLLEAMSPALNAVGNAMHVPYTSLMMLLTIPVFVSMPVALLVGPVTGTTLKYRTVLSAGLLMLGLGGIAPFWLRDWTMILAARAVFGVGQGIIMTLVLALIFSLVHPKNQALMMGMQNFVAGAAGMLFSVASGALAEKNWADSFLLNGSALVVLVIVLIFLPEPQRHEPPVSISAAAKSRPLGGLPPALWIYFILTFAYAVLLFPSMGNISIVFDQLGLSSTLAGVALMLLTGGATAAGLIFGPLFGKVGLKMIPIGFFVAGLSQVLFALGDKFYLFAIGELLLGFGALGLAFSGLCMAAGKSVDADKSAVVMAITLTGMNAGTFVSPLLFTLVMTLTGITSMRFPWWVGAVGFALLFILSLSLKEGPAQTKPSPFPAEAA